MVRGDPRAGGHRGPLIDPRAGTPIQSAGSGTAQSVTMLTGRATSVQQSCGLKYPLQIANGRLVLSCGIDHIKENVSQIIQTLPGEYLFFSEFGCNLRKRIFVPTTATALAKHDILSAIQKWEPRVAITEIAAETNESDVGIMRLDVRFTIDGEKEEHKMSTEIRRAG